MKPKLIYLEESEDKYLSDTWVELIGEGNYAITQTGYGSYKKQHFVVYLSRKQIEQILKEEEVVLPDK